MVKVPIEKRRVVPLTSWTGVQHQAGIGNWASPGVHTLTQWYKPVEFN